MVRNLEVVLLRTFVAVVDHGNMTAAGDALHLTQSAVSQQIARLETAVGQRLLVRSRQGVGLTASGQRLLPKAREILALNDATCRELDAGVAHSTVQLGIPDDLVRLCLPAILRSHAAEFPGVQIALMTGPSADLAAALDQGHLDLALVEEERATATGECLAVQALVWIGAKGGSAHLKSPLPISLVSPSCAFRAPVVSALVRRRQRWSAHFEGGSIEATMASVRSDLAVTASFLSTAPDDLVVLPPMPTLPALPDFAISLVVADKAPGPHLAGVLSHIRSGVDAMLGAQRAGAPSRLLMH